jgi:hypothetical protein
MEAAPAPGESSLKGNYDKAKYIWVGHESNCVILPPADLTLIGELIGNIIGLVHFFSQGQLNKTVNFSI